MKIAKLLQLPDTFDPDDRRRRQILNIILVFFILGGLFSVIATFSYGDTLSEIISDGEGSLILMSSVSVVVVFAVLFALNRREWAGNLAGWLFVVSLLVIIYISDFPDELVGRGLIFWTLPILAGGFVLPPFATFLVASLVSIIHIYISAILLHIPASPYSIGFSICWRL